MKKYEQPTCLDPFFASFEQALSSKNCKPKTLKNYRHLLRRLGHLLDGEGIAPSSLSTELVAELARQLPASPKAQVKVPNLARLFVEHLIAIGVATRPPLSAAQTERQELLGNLALYLLRQRGLSPRSVKHVLGFAARFLAHRFKAETLDLSALTARDIVAFMEHVVARKTPYRDKTLSTHLRGFFQYLFAQGLTTTNLSLCVPSVRKPWRARLPRYLSPDEVEAVLASVATSPRRGARDYRWREARRSMDEVLVFEMLDERCTSFTNLGPRLHGCLGARCFQCLAGQALEELLRTHVRQEFIGSDSLAGDARDHTAVRHTAAARQNVDQHRANGDPKRVTIEGELAMLIEQGDRMAREALAGIKRSICTGVDADVLPGEGQNHESHQHVILDRRAAERIMERVGAKISDHVMALLGHVGANLRRGDRIVVIVARGGFACSIALGFCCRGMR